jgi:trimeric autotransporter adhesin
MKKLALIVLLVLMAQFGYSQVGINTTNPNAQLDIRSSNQVTPSNNDGILIPRIDAFPLTNPTAAQQGMMVYLTTVSAGKQPGFYYWDNTGTPQWIGFNTGVSGDDDWYEVGGTNAPNNINDDMFHTGSVGIGNNNPTYKLDVDETASGKIYAMRVRHSNPIDGSISSGIQSSISGSFATGVIQGISTSITPGSGTAASGLRNSVGGSSTADAYGVNNSISTSGSGSRTGINNSFPGTGTGISYGMFNSFTNPNAITLGVNSRFTASGIRDKTGVKNEISNSTGGFHTGISNEFSNNNGAIEETGVFSQFSGSSVGNIRGIYNEITNSGTGNIHYGLYNNINGSGGLRRYGVENILSGTSTSEEYGIENTISTSGTNRTHYGVRNYLSGTGTGSRIGIDNWLSGSGTGDQYGVNNYIDNSGTGTKYGIYNYIPPATNGLHYGVYSNATKANSYAGYFLGRMSIGTTVANNYIMPLSRGTANQIMQTDGTGNVTWQNPNTALNNFAWTTTGNSGLNATTNFIGTTDDVDIVFKRNNAKAGLLGSYIAGYGTLSLNNNTTGNANAAFGASSLRSNTTGSSNVAIGTDAMSRIVQGSFGTTIGSAAMFYFSGPTGPFTNTNVAIGFTAMLGEHFGSLPGSNNVGLNNTVVGYSGLQGISSGNDNTVSGYRAGYTNTTGSDNCAFGSETLFSNTVANKNVAIGSSALYQQNFTNGGVGYDTDNIAIGFEALYSNNPTTNINASNNVAIGNYSMRNNSTGFSNVSIGINALHDNTTGYSNVVLGTGALATNITGYNNLAIGNQAMLDNVNGFGNVSLGNNSLFNNVSGSNNIAIGDGSIYGPTNSTNNIAIGSGSLGGSASTNSNVAVGVYSLRVSTASTNTAIGFENLYNATSASGLASVGYRSQYTNTTGVNNSTLGYQSLYSNFSGSGNIAIGYQAGYSELGSNRLYIENSNSSTPLIYGEFDTDLARINGNFRVKSTTVASAEMQVKNSNLYNHPADTNLNFGTGGGYFMVSTQDASPSSETGGIRGDGDNVSIWSPGDGGRQLRILDEDAWTDNNGNPYDNAAEVAYIAANGQYFQVSDKNKKENIAKIEDASTKISKISGYTYRYKLNQQEIEKGQKPIPASGVLAQEVEQVLPEAIQKNESGEYFVDYAAITPLLIEAIKEQNAKIKSLETTNAEILKRLELLENK